MYQYLKSLNYQLYSVLLLTSLIPAIYSTVRIYFLGSIPDTWAFSIAAQVAWLNLFYEVISEGLLLPLYFILGQVVADKFAFFQRVGIALGVVVGAFAITSAIVLLFAGGLVKIMAQADDLVALTTDYIQAETVAIMLSSVYALVIVVLVVLNARKELYTLLVTKTVLTIAFDSALVSQLPFSLKLGVMGVAYTNIAVNSLLLVFSVIAFARLGVSFSWGKNASIRWMRQWFAISAVSGLESFVRNTAFMFMILKLVNEVQEAGTFWVTNQFIWGWLLLPILAMGTLIKQDTATSRGQLAERFKGYVLLTAIWAGIWVISIPLWPLFLSEIMGIIPFGPVYHLTLVLLAFYIVFAFNNIIDSYFYGMGRMDLMLYQSLIVNIVFYGGAFAAYHLGYFQPTLLGIAVMFGIGIVFDAIVTFALFVMVYHRSNKVAL